MPIRKYRQHHSNNVIRVRKIFLSLVLVPLLRLLSNAVASVRKRRTKLMEAIIKDFSRIIDRQNDSNSVLHNQLINSNVRPIASKVAEIGSTIKIVNRNASKAETSGSHRFSMTIVVHRKRNVTIDRQTNVSIIIEHHAAIGLMVEIVVVIVLMSRTSVSIAHRMSVSMGNSDLSN